MRFHNLGKALLVLVVAAPLVLITACEKSGFTGSSDKKASKRNDQDQTAQGAPQSQPQSPYGYSPSPAQAAPAGTSAGTGTYPNTINPNAFSSPNTLGAGQSAYNPLGFPNAPGGINGYGGDTPLILDWNRDGSISVAAGMVAFDINGDGLADKTEWVSADERLLALDLNRNGYIDSAKELFGSATVNAQTFTNAAHGFQALAVYDTNKDHRIDRQDAVYGQLLVWQDKNTNGVSETGELTRLTDTDVIALNSLYKTLPMGRGIIRGSHSRIGFESVYETGEGIHLLADVIFYNQRNAAFLNAALPHVEVVR